MRAATWGAGAMWALQGSPEWRCPVGGRRLEPRAGDTMPAGRWQPRLPVRAPSCCPVLAGGLAAALRLRAPPALRFGGSAWALAAGRLWGAVWGLVFRRRWCRADCFQGKTPGEGCGGCPGTSRLGGPGSPDPPERPLGSSTLGATEADGGRHSPAPRVSLTVLRSRAQASPVSPPLRGPFPQPGGRLPQSRREIRVLPVAGSAARSGHSAGSGRAAPPQTRVRGASGGRGDGRPHEALSCPRWCPEAASAPTGPLGAAGEGRAGRAARGRVGRWLLRHCRALSGPLVTCPGSRS